MKHVIHLAKVAHSYYFISVCGIRINYPLQDGHPIFSFEQCDKENILRRVGDLKEVNCKACQKTFIYVQKLKDMIVPILIGETR